MNRSSNKRTRRSSSRKLRSSSSKRSRKRSSRSSKRSKKGGWGASATKDKPFLPSLLSGGWGGAPELGF